MRNIYILILFLTSCSQIEVTPIDLTKMVNDTTVYNMADVEILQSFKAPACEENRPTSNVYKVKVIGTKDTVFVFEVCQRMIWNQRDYDDYRMVWVKGELTLDTVYVPTIANVKYNTHRFLVGSIKKAEF